MSPPVCTPAALHCPLSRSGGPLGRPRRPRSVRSAERCVWEKGEGDGREEGAARLAATPSRPQPTAQRTPVRAAATKPSGHLRSSGFGPRPLPPLKALASVDH
ncbi:hypothetical protein NDU88_004072 [Pleurodeles waltl]|uniref:Uncharacterized protein n=1 Tax=Pleurodeles waltl TaxID=8319 RepID=A0AAV7VIR4_PLEWA|nr:hypothetical protein NDU88_004072 [Pleurodeles waltl]